MILPVCLLELWYFPSSSWFWWFCRYLSQSSSALILQRLLLMFFFGVSSPDGFFNSVTFFPSKVESLSEGLFDDAFSWRCTSWHLCLVLLVHSKQSALKDLPGSPHRSHRAMCIAPPNLQGTPLGVNLIPRLGKSMHQQLIEGTSCYSLSGPPLVFPSDSQWNIRQL